MKEAHGLLSAGDISNAIKLFRKCFLNDAFKSLDNKDNAAANSMVKLARALHYEVSQAGYEPIKKEGEKYTPVSDCCFNIHLLFLNLLILINVHIVQRLMQSKSRH